MPGVERVSLDELLGAPTSSPCTCRWRAATSGLIGARELRLMRPGSILVNTSRGGVSTRRALLSALRDGHLAGAGIDVFEREPPRGSALLELAQRRRLAARRGHQRRHPAGDARDGRALGARRARRTRAGRPPQPAGAAQRAPVSGRPLRVGIAGAGIGLRYARSFQAVPGVEVAALCAATTRTAGPAAEELGIGAVHTSYEEMLGAHELDIAVVATPNDLHREQTLAAVERGLHVVCDKPLAMDAGQARADARRRGRRGRAPARAVLAALRARRCARPASCWPATRSASRSSATCAGTTSASATRTGRGAGSSRARGPGSGAIANLGPHVVDLVELLAGPLVAVSAGAALSVRERDGGRPRRRGHRRRHRPAGQRRAGLVPGQLGRLGPPHPALGLGALRPGRARAAPSRRAGTARSRSASR